jgi:hypothetical protein
MASSATVIQEVQVDQPAQLTRRGVPYIGLVKGIANGKAFLVGINTSAQGSRLEPMLVPIDELDPASPGELLEAARAHCDAHCKDKSGSVNGLCWACQTLVRR